MFAGSISSGKDHGIHSCWDLIRSKHLSSISVCHAKELTGFSGHGNSIHNLKLEFIKKENNAFLNVRIMLFYHESYYLPIIRSLIVKNVIFYFRNENIVSILLSISSIEHLWCLVRWSFWKIQTHTHTHTHTHTYIYIYIYIYICMCVCVCVRARVSVCVCVPLRVSVRVRLCVCKWICIYACFYQPCFKTNTISSLCVSLY